MRNLFLALVLANLAFAAWQRLVRAAAARGPARRRRAAGITLVSEVPDRSAQ